MRGKMINFHVRRYIFEPTGGLVVPWRALWTGRSWFTANRCALPVVRMVVGWISWIGCGTNRGVVEKSAMVRCCSSVSPFSSVEYKRAGNWGNCGFNCGCWCCCRVWMCGMYGCCWAINVGVSADSFSSVTGLASSSRLFGAWNGCKVFARAGDGKTGRRARRNGPLGTPGLTKRSLRYWIGCRTGVAKAPGIENRGGNGPNCELIPVRQQTRTIWKERNKKWHLKWSFIG